MAQVVRQPRSPSLIDKDLANLLGFWRAVPELQAEWPEWDQNSRLDLIHDWPIERETLQRVQDASRCGLLNKRQQREWLELARLIETHRETVEAMLGEPI